MLLTGSPTLSLPPSLAQPASELRRDSREGSSARHESDAQRSHRDRCGDDIPIGAYSKSSSSASGGPRCACSGISVLKSRRWRDLDSAGSSRWNGRWARCRRPASGVDDGRADELIPRRFNSFEMTVESAVYAGNALPPSVTTCLFRERPAQSAEILASIAHLTKMRAPAMVASILARALMIPALFMRRSMSRVRKRATVAGSSPQKPYGIPRASAAR